MEEKLHPKLEEAIAAVESISSQLKPGDRCKGCIVIGMGKKETKIKFDLNGGRK